jgi:toxin YoeB
VKVLFTSQGWDDYQYWVENDPTLLTRVNLLIRDARRNAFVGIGKPEPLKGHMSGWWSRRITAEHRLVYRVAGKAGADQWIEIAMCRNHYM